MKALVFLVRQQLLHFDKLRAFPPLLFYFLITRKSVSPYKAKREQLWTFYFIEQNQATP